MRIFKNKISLSIIFIFCCFFSIKVEKAIAYTVMQITDDDAWDMSPQIHNGQVVWRYSRPYDNGIRLYDSNKIIRIPGSYNGYSPQIYNGQVVWTGWDDNDWEIFFYDGTKTIQLTSNSYGDTFPQINNGQIVWQGYDGHDWEIFLYDGSQIIQLTNNNYSEIPGDIDNGQVVWSGWDGHDMEIFFYDGAKTIQLTNNEYHDDNPKIHNGQIVWGGYDGHDMEIFFYDGAKTIQLTNNDYYDTSPRIHNGQIAWLCTGSDGHDYEIFFYDGNRTIQLTNNDYDDSGVQIYGGKIVWQGYDGHDNEIFLYNGTKVIQLTNNDYYNDVSPKIHNGQVVWYGYYYGGHDDYEVFLAKPAAGLEILDGVDFTSGREISSDPKSLIASGYPVEGSVTDGVVRLLLRLNVDKPQTVTFSLQGTGNRMEDGILRAINGYPAPEGNQLTVNTIEVDGKNYAFAIYQAPDNFVRDSFQEEDKKTSERSFSIKVESGSIPTIDKKIKLVRPPLILVHGLWSNKEMWDGFKIMLQYKIPGLQIFTVDYETTNSNHFLDNKDVPYSCKGGSISSAKEKFRSDKIAMIQADVLGHSMGGLLARIYAAGEVYYRKGWYLDDRNFKEGSINKLITLDSSHYGSFLAEAAMSYIHQSKIADLITWFFKKTSHSLTEGAVEDLMNSSESINNLNYAETEVPVHSIVGEYVGVVLDYDTDRNGTVRYVLEGLPFDYADIHNFLMDEGYGNLIIPAVINMGSDLVVSAYSQRGGLEIPFISTFNHHHLSASTEEVANRVVELLNANTDKNLFNIGFPKIN